MARRPRHFRYPRIRPGSWLAALVLIGLPTSASAVCDRMGSGATKNGGHFDGLVEIGALEGVPADSNHPAPRCTGAFCAKNTPSESASTVPGESRPEPLADVREFVQVASNRHLPSRFGPGLRPIGRKTLVERPPRAA